MRPKTKVCGICEEEMSGMNFNKNLTTKDGLDRRCKSCVNNRRLMLRYGISMDTYNKLLIEQNNVCAICKEPETMVSRGKTKPLSIDHNHKTGGIRGLLCHSCNVAYGLLKESEENMLSMISYHRKHSKP